jgi:hypothetical protein
VFFVHYAILTEKIVGGLQKCDIMGVGKCLLSAFLLRLSSEVKILGFF